MTSPAFFERRLRIWTLLTIILSCLLPIAGAGCDRQTGHERFLPTGEVARGALELTLEQWRRGEALDTITSQSLPKVQPVDSLRSSKQKLLHYEILGEISGGGPKCFAVQVKLDHPLDTQKIRFVVLGQDPLWVVRQEDFEMLEQWSHPMNKDDSKSGNKKK